MDLLLTPILKAKNLQSTWTIPIVLENYQVELNKYE